MGGLLLSFDVNEFLHGRKSLTSSEIVSVSRGIHVKWAAKTLDHDIRD